MTTTAQHEAIASLCEARTKVEAARIEARMHYPLVDDDQDQADAWRVIASFGAALDQVDAALRTATDALPDVQLLDGDDDDEPDRLTTWTPCGDHFLRDGQHLAGDQ